jgi:hypothetical protein
MKGIRGTADVFKIAIDSVASQRRGIVVFQITTKKQKDHPNNEEYQYRMEPHGPFPLTRFYKEKDLELILLPTHTPTPHQPIGKMVKAYAARFKSYSTQHRYAAEQKDQNPPPSMTIILYQQIDIIFQIYYRYKSNR